ncbi:MAG: VanZ family protein [bacterium]
MNIIYRRILWTGLTLSYTALTFYLSTLDISFEIMKWSYKRLKWVRGDWVLHAIEFGILALLLLAMNNSFNNKVRRDHPVLLLSIIFLTGVIGMLNEWVQSFTPGREVSLGDVIANFVGATLAIGGIKFLRHYSSLTEQSRPVPPEVH